MRPPDMVWPIIYLHTHLSIYRKFYLHYLVIFVFYTVLHCWERFHILLSLFVLAFLLCNYLQTEISVSIFICFGKVMAIKKNVEFHRNEGLHTVCFSSLGNLCNSYKAHCSKIKKIIILLFLSCYYCRNMCGIPIYLWTFLRSVSHWIWIKVYIQMIFLCNFCSSLCSWGPW